MEKKKDKEIYSYMLRFNKELERDRQALDKITQFCRVTDMTMMYQRYIKIFFL